MLRAPHFGLQCVEKKEEIFPFAYGRWKMEAPLGKLNPVAATAFVNTDIECTLFISLDRFHSSCRHSVPFVIFPFDPDEELFLSSLNIE